MRNKLAIGGKQVKEEDEVEEQWESEAKQVEGSSSSSNNSSTLGVRHRIKPGQRSEWVGVYTMIQEQADPSKPLTFPRIHVTFDMQMVLESLAV